MDFLTIGAANKYTDDSIAGTAGVLAGKNCTIDSTTKTGSVTTVVFKWTADDNTVHTSSIQVNDGAKGDKGDTGEVGQNGTNGVDGVGIQSVVDNGNNTFTITLTNGTPTIIDKIDTINSDVVTQGTTNLYITPTQVNKLTNIEENAEVNNISDANATDLTDSGDTTLHYHTSDRDRTNHTGTQAIATVSGLQTALDSKTNKDFTLYTQKSDVDNNDKIAINDSVDNNSIKYVTLNQLVSSVQDPHNKGYFETGTALNTAIPTANDGDFAVVGATETVWVWSSTSEAFVDSGANGAVLSVNGRTGVITLTKADVGLNNVDNTSDLEKPISTLTQTALNLKADDLDLTTHTTNTSNPHGVTKSQVGLSNVVNVDTTTTANITDSTDKRFITDAQKTVLENTSGVPTGGTTNQVLTKNSNSDYDFSWADGIQISDNETVENKTWSSSKIASEIPTTLPANGGNADTVNNHTVKSDVPENAVFTDTVYDDTEVKGSITAISDRVKTVEDDYANITKLDVPVTDVTFTNPKVSKAPEGEVCKYCVKNGVCYVTLNGLSFSSSYVRQEDFMALPKPVMRQDFELTDEFGTTVLGKLFLETHGRMHLWTNTIPVTAKTGFISFSYPVAES